MSSDKSDEKPDIALKCPVCGDTRFVWGSTYPGISFIPRQKKILKALFTRGAKAACCQNCGYIMMFYWGIAEKRRDEP